MDSNSKIINRKKRKKAELVLGPTELRYKQPMRIIHTENEKPYWLHQTRLGNLTLRDSSAIP
jgi:hypothetical protein